MIKSKFFQDELLTQNLKLALFLNSIVIILVNIYDTSNILFGASKIFMSFNPWFACSYLIDLFIVLAFRKSKHIYLYFFISHSIKSGLHYGYRDGGHYFFQITLLFGIISFYLNDKKWKRYSLILASSIFLIGYFFSGLNKITTDDYVSGYAILKLFGNTTWNTNYSELANSLFSAVPFSLPVIGTSVVLMEILFPVLIFLDKRACFPAMVVFITFHIFVYVFMELVSFSLIMIIFNICLLGGSHSLIREKLKLINKKIFSSPTD